MIEKINIEIIKAHAEKEKKKVKEFITLSEQNDPFYIQPASKEKAEWVHKIWKQEGEPTIHPRGFHYRILGCGYKLPSGSLYLNDSSSWNFLENGFKYARLLELIPYEKILDHKNPEPDETGYFQQHEGIYYNFGMGNNFKYFYEDYSEEEYINNIIEDKITNFTINYNPSLLQPFHIEIWAEKSAIIPRNVAAMFNATLRPAGGGEFSLNMCYKAVARAKEFGKPLFVFILTDHDPKGADMPKSIARKIEYISQQKNVTAFVEQIALTKEQCIKYKLPSVPAKNPKGNGTGAKGYKTHIKNFNNAMGKESTEINALMERHEEQYDEEICHSISPYFDDKMQEKVKEMNRDIEKQIKTIIKSVIETNKEKIIEVAKKLTMAEKDLEEFIENKREELKIDELRRNFSDLTHINPEKIINSVKVELPEADYTEPKNILLDTRRDYFEQMKIYKKNDIRSPE